MSGPNRILTYVPMLVFGLSNKIITAAHTHSSLKKQKQEMTEVENGCSIKSKAHEWYPHEIIAGNGHACLVLNRDIRQPTEVVKQIWQNAQIRSCVDGGANRWRKFLKEQKIDGCKLKLPDLITGDFDSITNENMEHFQAQGVQTIHTPDQDETDFTKALNIVRTKLEEKPLRCIVVLHDTSGRFDHIMANINTLYKFQDDSMRIFLLSSNSLTWLLKPGKHIISVSQELVDKERWCSLIPIGHVASNVTTKGLKWNLTNGCLAFGALVSTSNSYRSSIVEVTTESPLIWSMGMFLFSDEV